MDEMLKKIKTCYCKIKKYYYDNYGLLIYKKKISEFENSSTFELDLEILADKLLNYNEDSNYFKELVSKINIIELSKNAFFVKRKLEVKSNYFIDIPVELLIIDAFLTCEFGLLLQKEKNKHFLEKEKVNFQSFNNLLDINDYNCYLNNKMMKYYKKGYDEWKRYPRNFIVKNDDCTVIKLDIKECYYSVSYEEKFFYELSNGEPILCNLLDIYFMLAKRYKELVDSIHKDKIKKQCFPVGLLSSNILFEYYMHVYVDSKVNMHEGLHLARYADDMIFIIDGVCNLKEFFERFKDIFYIEEYCEKNRRKFKNYIVGTGFCINNSKIRLYNFEKNDPYGLYKIKKLFEKNNASEQNIIEFELSEKPKYDSNGNETDMNILRKAQKIKDIYLDYELVDEDDPLIITFKKDIENLFSSYKLINYRTSWTKFFEFIILVYNKKLEKIDELVCVAKNMMHKKLKEKNLLYRTLCDELDVALLLAKASFDIVTKENLSIKNSLMFNVFEKNIKFKIQAEKNKYCPYYISDDERLFSEFIVPTTEYSCEELEINDVLIECNNYNIRAIDFDKYERTEKINDVGIIVANICIHKETVLDNLKCGKTSSSEKKVLIEILENCKKIKKQYGNTVKYLLLPEFFLDYLWIKDIIDFCKETNISVITGMMLKKYTDLFGKEKVINNLYYFVPYKGYGKTCNVYIGKREKNYYSPEEEKNFHELSLWYNENKPLYHLIQKDKFIFTPLLCYEFTSPEARYIFKGVVHGVFVSELNKDTNYFSSIIHSTARELHSFVIQANSSVYGDTRVTMPSSTRNMNLISVKGGLNNTLHYTTLSINKLLESELQFLEIRNQYKTGKLINKYESDFKITSAGFKRISLTEFIENIK